MIKAESTSIVKTQCIASLLLASLLLTLLFLTTASAADSKHAPKPTDADLDAEAVKPVDAEEFRVRLTKQSTSGQVLLFEETNDTVVKPGKVLLIKSNSDDIAAVRVLRTYEHGKFSAKLLVSFADSRLNEEYRAVKKIGDKVNAQIKEREKRTDDLSKTKTDEDLALEVAPDDKELDRGIPPPTKTLSNATSLDEADEAGSDAEMDQPAPKSKQAARPKNKPAPLFDSEGNELGQESLEVSDEDEPLSEELTAHEETSLDPFKHMVSLEYVSIYNMSVTGSNATYNGLGLRYAYTPFQKMLFKRRSLQDSLSLEASVFYYTISGLDTAGDSITLLPIEATLRYNVNIGESFVLFGYVGALQNLIVQRAALLTSSTTQYAQARFAGGAGLLLKIGPSWAVRVEYGSDLFGVGACLKF